jgi:ribonuclease HI
MDCVHQVKGCGAKVLLKNYEVIKIQVSIRLNFVNTNNQSEYKACIARLQQVAEIVTQEILLRSDLKVMIS